MRQSRAMSIIESMTNVGIGYCVAVVAQILIFPAFGVDATLEQNLKIGAAFTAVSIVRTYAVRRIFERALRKAWGRDTNAGRPMKYSGERQ